MPSAPPRSGLAVRASAFALSPALVLGALAPQDASPENAPRGPGRRTEVAGMSALAARTRVVFRSAPDRPHEVLATFAFPDRARFWIAPEGASERRLRYAWGERAFALEPGSAESVELAGVERLNTLRQLALRRALFLWPDGHPWEPDQTGRRLADLGAVGSLVATLGPDGLPTAMESRDTGGQAYERWSGIEWAPGEGRRWPSRYALSVGDDVIWDEQVLSVDSDVRYVDAFFLPPDRRSAVATAAKRDERVQAVDVPPMVFRVVPLPAGAEWQDALTAAEDARKRIADELGSDGAELDRFATFLLDPQGRPSAVLVRLGYGAPRTPPGFERREEFPAVSLRVEALAEVGPEALRRLRAAAGEGAHGTPYVRIAPPDRPGPRAQVVLPLERG